MYAIESGDSRAASVTDLFICKPFFLNGVAVGVGVHKIKEL